MTTIAEGKHAVRRGFRNDQICSPYLALYISLSLPHPPTLQGNAKCVGFFDSLVYWHRTHATYHDVSAHPYLPLSGTAAGRAEERRARVLHTTLIGRSAICKT